MSVADEPATLDLRQLLRVLGRRRWLLVLPWAAAMGLGTAAAFLLQPIYTSHVLMVLEQPQTLSGPLGGMVNGGANAEQQADLMKGQVQSTAFLRGVIAAAGLRNEPRARARALQHADDYPGMPVEQRVEAVLADHLRDAIEVRRTKGDVFDVSVEDFAPEGARRLAGAVAAQFVMSSKAQQLEAARATQTFSVEQQEIYRRRLAESEARLEAATRATAPEATPVDAGNLTRARGLLDQAALEVDEQRQKVATLRAQLQERDLLGALPQLSSPRSSMLAAQLVELDQDLSSAMVNQVAGAGAGSDIRLLITRRFGELEAELERVAGTVLPAAPADARDLLVRARLAQADLDAKQAGRDAIQRQLSAYQRQQTLAPDRDVTLARLRQQVEQDQQLYNSFVQQAAAAQITEAYQTAKVSGRFSVLQPANHPSAPTRPNRPLLLALAFLLGGIIGVGTVLVVEQHDDSVKDADEVESTLGLPVLGAVPRVPELMRSGRRTAETGLSRGRGAQAAREGLLHRLKVESPLGLEFRRVFLKLARVRGRALPRTLMVTSATRGEGKSTTAACLAITLARELREPVLLVDLDLRSPTLHRVLGLPSSTWGVAQMLHSRVFDETYVRATAQPHLDFLAAGRSEHPASELIDTVACEWFVEQVSARYSVVVLDAPPNLAVPDPLIAGRAVEAVIYVIKAGTTVRKAAEYGVKVQREARDNVIGVLVNDAGEVLPSYYGYRAKSYGYSPEEAGGA
jgi:polysaccharide biosynthesis transport protein